MVGSPRPGYVRRLRGSALALGLALVCLPVAAQDTISLREVNLRNPAAEYTPTNLNRKVTVSGVVNSLPFLFPSYSLVAFQANGYGAVVRVAGDDRRLDTFKPGEQIRVTGTIAVFAGMPVIIPDTVAKFGEVQPPPEPKLVTLANLQSNQNLG